VSPPSDPVTQARQAVGSTRESRARWLLKFSRLNFQNLGPDQVAQWQVGVAVFLGLDLRLQTQNGGFAPQQLPTTTEVRQWQKDLKQRLDSLAQGQVWSNVSAQLRFALRLSGGRLVVQGTITPLHQADRFMVKAVETLANVRDRVRQCAREDCKQAFVGNMRQTYCTATCRGTVNTRRYRQQSHP